MRIPGKRVNRIRLVRTPRFAAAVEVEAVFPDEDPSEACFESETVRLLREVKRHAERGDVRWLQRRGKVYRAIEAASYSLPARGTEPGSNCSSAAGGATDTVARTASPQLQHFVTARGARPGLRFESWMLNVSPLSNLVGAPLINTRVVSPNPEYYVLEPRRNYPGTPPSLTQKRHAGRDRTTQAAPSASTNVDNDRSLCLQSEGELLTMMEGNLVREQSERIRAFLIRRIYEKSTSPAADACEKFGLSRQAVGRHMRRLSDENVIMTEGKTKGRKYILRPIANETFTLPISQDLQEDRVWRERVLPLLAGVRENVIGICQYGFTEILNNAIAHSEGKSVAIKVERTLGGVTMTIWDDGIGIFNKIKRVLHLDDARHAILELTKGKVTTDPAHHTGEGIFFSSRVFDKFAILSDTLLFIHGTQDTDWLLDDVGFHARY